MNLPTSKKISEHLGALRDLALAIAAITYALGYVVWSVVALVRGFGPRPVVQAQYFVAGLPPLLALAATFAVARLAHIVFLIRWPARFAAMRLRWQVLTLVVWLAAGFIAMVVGFRLVFPQGSAGHSVSGRGVLTAVLLLILLALLRPANFGTVLMKRVEAFTEGRGARIRWSPLALQLVRKVETSERAYGVFYVYLLPLATCIIMLWLFATEYYPRMPQALGGARPECVMVDVDVAKLAPETLEALKLPAGPTTARSAAVLLVFAGSESLVLQSSTERTAATLIEIRRDAVSTITSCPRTD